MNKEITRQNLLSAAKSLFIKNGYEETTMSDIAQEAKLCRRTVYAYYDSKAEIYKAVVDIEVKIVLDDLTSIATRNIPPQQKIIEFIYGHFRILKEMVDRNGTLRSTFFRNIWGLEHFRKGFDQKEMQMLQRIISEGKAEGVFNVINVKRTTEIILNCMRGFEVPYIRGQIWKGNSIEEMRLETKKLIYGALGYNINK